MRSVPGSIGQIKVGRPSTGTGYGGIIVVLTLSGK